MRAVQSLRRVARPRVERQQRPAGAPRLLFQHAPSARVPRRVGAHPDAPAASAPRRDAADWARTRIPASRFPPASPSSQAASRMRVPAATSAAMRRQNPRATSGGEWRQVGHRRTGIDAGAQDFGQPPLRRRGGCGIQHLDAGDRLGVAKFERVRDVMQHADRARAGRSCASHRTGARDRTACRSTAPAASHPPREHVLRQSQAVVAPDRSRDARGSM